MFRACDVVVVNKLDLLPHLDFDLDRFLANLRAVNPAADVIQVSARTGDGVAQWCDWLLAARQRRVATMSKDHDHPEPHEHAHQHDDGVSHSHVHSTHEHEHTEHDHDHGA